MNWKTHISKVSKNKIEIRNKPIEELMENFSYSEAVFFLFQNRKPTEDERKMMDAIFVSCIDHGTIPQSTTTTRVVASAGVSLSSAVSAGILAVGEYHGGAIEQSAKFIQDNVKIIKEHALLSEVVADNIVKDYLSKKKIIPGYGHNLHSIDPRAEKLFELGKKFNIYSDHCIFAKNVLDALHKNGKKIPLNIDGAIAAVISDMNFDWRIGKAFFIISRVPGLVAHYHEEIKNFKPLRIIYPDASEYVN